MQRKALILKRNNGVRECVFSLADYTGYRCSRRVGFFFFLLLIPSPLDPVFAHVLPLGACRVVRTEQPGEKGRLDNKREQGDGGRLGL